MRIFVYYLKILHIVALELQDEEINAEKIMAVTDVVCYTAVFSVVTQRSSPLTAAENRTTFLSLCVCGLTNKPIMYKKFDNT